MSARASTARAMAPDALVFDMDGLLLDTERIALRAFEEACGEAGWPDPDLDVYARCIGSTGGDEGAILRAGYGPDFPWDAVRDGWWRRYHEHVEHRAVPVKPGATELLSYCVESGLPCALATSTRAALAQRKLSLAGLDGYFPVRVTGDMVRRGKPDPEPYLSAAARLGARPERCWAFEDSANGVRSACAAGFEVFQVPDLVEPLPELRRLGHTVLESLYDAIDELREARKEAWVE